MPYNDVFYDYVQMMGEGDDTWYLPDVHKSDADVEATLRDLVDTCTVLGVTVGIYDKRDDGTYPIHIFGVLES